MTESSLQQFIFGRAANDNPSSDLPSVLAKSSEISADDAAAVYQFVPLDPLGDSEQSFALMTLDSSPVLTATGRMVLARAQFQATEATWPIHHFVYLPREALIRLGDIEALLKLFPVQLPNYSAVPVLETLPLPLPPTWTLDKSALSLEQISDSLSLAIPKLIAILDLALKQTLVISGFPVDSQARLYLVRGLMLLLPTLARPELSFTSFSIILNGNLPRLVFSETKAGADSQNFTWNDLQSSEFNLQHPYAMHLQQLWHEDYLAFVESIRSMDNLAPSLMLGKSLNDGLVAMVKRQNLDMILTAGGSISAEDAIEVLQTDKNLSKELRLAYLRALLQQALELREAKYAFALRQALNQSPELEEALEADFYQALDNYPDALYALLRAGLSKDEQPEAKWLKRLHDAASRSIQIALDSGDPNTIGIWLTLLSREPLRFELSAILHHAILAARDTVAQSPKLAQELLTVAVKRQPETLPTLLGDTALLAVLPPELLAALRDFSPEAIEKLAENSRELFLLAIQQAIQAENPVISPSSIRALWNLHKQQQTNTLLPLFRPQILFLSMAEHSACLMDNGLETLLTLLLADTSEANFLYEIAPILAEQGRLAAPFIEAIQQSHRDLHDVMEILNKFLYEEWFQAQAVVDAYAFILSEREWDEISLPLLEQLARILTQHPETNTQTTVLWRMAEISGELKNEQMLKVALRRLLDALAILAVESQIIENILRLRKAAQWSPIGRGVLSRWWRHYCREQSTVQLQKLDKALEGKRNLDDLRATVQTSLAMRRILANRSLEEFAEDVATTYSILEALSEGFDPDDKHVDSAAIRSELESRSDEINADSRHILATNLKELANLITTLADSRSKPSLMKSDDTLERQLLMGEQQPQSAVDVMRWLSGFLDGVQKGEGE